MSYYSTIKIVAGKNPAHEIRNVLKNHQHRHQLSEVGTNERGDTLFEAVWVKWYEDDPQEFPDVSEVMEVVNKYVSMDGYENADNGIEYARIGEETTDVEYYRNGSYGYLTIGVVCDNEDSFKADRYLKMAKAINPSLGDTK